MSSNIGGVNGANSSSGVTTPKSGTEELKKKQEEQQVLGQQKSSQSATDMWNNLESTATQQSQNIQEGQQTKEGQQALQGQDVQQEQNTQQKQQALQGQDVQQEQKTEQKQQALQGQGVQQEQNTQQKQQTEAKDGKVYAQNGETFDKTAERLGFKKGTEEYENFKKANSEAAEKGWFYLHKEVSVPDDLKSKLTDGAYDTDTNAEQAKWKAWVDGGKKSTAAPAESSSAKIPKEKQTVTDDSVTEQASQTEHQEETAEQQAIQPQERTVQHQKQTVQPQKQSNQQITAQQTKKSVQPESTKKADNKDNPTSPQVTQSNEETNGIGDIDGKFNDFIIQNNKTGDCYLIGALDSVLAKQKGKQALENNITVDKQNNTAQVKYGNKNYNVNLSDANHRDDLDDGGGDARLYEMAEENKRLNSGHRSTSPTDSGDVLYDGRASEAYRNMGLKDVKEEPVPGKFDYNQFNDPNKAYAYRRGEVPGRTGSPMGTSKSEGQVALKPYHQYAVLGATKDAVLFHNPYKPFDPNHPIGDHTIYVPKSELEKYPYWLDSGSFA